jgi:hypothetical protein
MSAPDHMVTCCKSNYVKSCVTGVVLGRGIAQAVNRRLPTAAVVFDSRSGRVGFVLDKVALE